jgi:hypothetical protein
MTGQSITNQFQPPRSLYIALAFGALAVAYALVYSHNRSIVWDSANPFWDASVYDHAIDNWRGHRDPYSTVSQGLLFVYPPVFLYAGGFLAALLPHHWGWYLFLGCHLSAFLGLPLLLSKCYFRLPWLSGGLACLIYAAEPGLAGLFSLRAGNVTSLLYFSALVAALPGLRRNSWGWFYLVVFLAGMIKPVFLLLLLLPIFAARRQVVPSAVCGLLSAATYPLQRWVAPTSYRGFITATYVQIAKRSDYGAGILGEVVFLERKFVHRVVDWPPLLAQAVFIVGILTALYLLRRRISLSHNGVWLALLLVAIVLCNPRIQRYDSCIGLLAAFVLLVEAFETQRFFLLLSVLFLPSVLSYTGYRFFHAGPWGSYETLVLLAGFGAGYWRLWRSSGDRQDVASHSRERRRAGDAIQVNYSAG